MFVLKVAVSALSMFTIASASAAETKCRPYTKTVQYCEGDKVLYSVGDEFKSATATGKFDQDHYMYYYFVMDADKTEKSDSAPVLVKKDICTTSSAGPKMCIGAKYSTVYGTQEEVIGYRRYSNEPAFVVVSNNGGKKSVLYVQEQELQMRAQKKTELADLNVRLPTRFSIPAQRAPTQAEFNAIVDNSSSIALKSMSSDINMDCMKKIGTPYMKVIVSDFALDKATCKYQYSKASSSFNWDFMMPGGDNTAVHRYPSNLLVMCDANIQYTCAYEPRR